MPRPQTLQSTAMLRQGTAYPQLLSEAIGNWNAIGNLVFGAQIAKL